MDCSMKVAAGKGVESATASFAFLAIRTNPEKLQFVRNPLETVSGGDAFFQFAWKTFHDLDNFRAARANQVVMVSVVDFANEFKSSYAVAEIKLFHHAHFFEQVHCPIDGGQVALAFGHAGEDFPVSQGVRMFSQNFQNSRARACDFTRLTAQPICQRGQRLRFV